MSSPGWAWLKIEIECAVGTYTSILPMAIPNSISVMPPTDITARIPEIIKTISIMLLLRSRPWR